MKIEVKLKDPKYCNGCPCVGWSDVTEGVWCDVDGGMEVGQYSEKIIRPQQCIDKYGE